MPANVNGIIIEQVYGDNSSGAEFDTDGDGTTTQEDEFVSVANTTGAPVDISGMQIWSDATNDTSGVDNADDNNGLYHTFPPGTILAPGETLYVVNEITGTPRYNMQEASEGGRESAPGDADSTNFISEGSSNSNTTEALALVDPSSGDYIVFNMGATAVSHVDNTGISAFSAFPGTNKLGEVNAAQESGAENMAAGSSYKYNSGTDSYEFSAVSVTCFAEGTMIAADANAVAVECLKPGDLVQTVDGGLRAVRMVMKRRVRFDAAGSERHKPILVPPGALGLGCPERPLRLSPQHRVLIKSALGTELLVPAKALVRNGRARVQRGCRSLLYVQLVLDRHEVIIAEGAKVESFYPGDYALRRMHPATRAEILRLFPSLDAGEACRPARPLMKVGQACRAMQGARVHDEVTPN